MVTSLCFLNLRCFVDSWNTLDLNITIAPAILNSEELTVSGWCALEEFGADIEVCNDRFTPPQRARITCKLEKHHNFAIICRLAHRAPAARRPLPATDKERDGRRGDRRRWHLNLPCNL